LTAKDACSVVKADLEEGIFTHYTDSFPIYITDKDKFQGGNVYIELKDSRRKPVQAFTGNAIYRKKNCTITINADNETNRDNLYDDIFDILIHSKSYTFIDERDIIGPLNYTLEINIEVLN